MTFGISAPSGITGVGHSAPTSPFTPADSQLNGARMVAANAAYQTRFKRKKEEDMREPSEVELADNHLKPVTGTAPPARTHKK